MKFSLYMLEQKVEWDEIFIAMNLRMFPEKDLIVLVLTLLIGLYCGIELGLITGVLINLLFLVYLWARPSIEISKCKVSKRILL